MEILKVTTNPPAYRPINNGLGFALACELHPDRLFPMDEALYEGLTRTETDDPETEYPLAVTRTGWTFGDIKSQVALCPQCTKQTYHMIFVFDSLNDARNFLKAEQLGSQGDDMELHDDSTFETIYVDRETGWWAYRLNGKHFNNPFAFVYCETEPSFAHETEMLKQFIHTANEAKV